MAKHTVLKKVLHNGKRYGKDSQIELTPEQAKPLIEAGHVVDPQAKKAEKAAE